MGIQVLLRIHFNDLLDFLALCLAEGTFHLLHENGGHLISLLLFILFYGISYDLHTKKVVAYGQIPI